VKSERGAVDPMFLYPENKKDGRRTGSGSWVIYMVILRLYTPSIPFLLSYKTFMPSA